MVRIGDVRVGIVDVGANTLRLLVATARRGPAGLRFVSSASSSASVRRSSDSVRIGEEEARGGRGDRGRARAVARASSAATAIDVLVTSPGRQAANGRELVSRLAEATARRDARPYARKRKASWPGTAPSQHSKAHRPTRSLVCDVGGGSTQVVVGFGLGWPGLGALLRSLASLRLTRRALGARRPHPRPSTQLGRR